MSKFTIWEEGDTKAFNEAKVGDTIETLGRKKTKETYQVVDVYEGKQGRDGYGVITAKIIKNNGTLGKKTMNIKNSYDSNLMFNTVRTTIHTK